MKAAITTEQLLPGDIVLTVKEIAELGLDEAPDDAGPSIEESLTNRTGRPDHG
jgi:hypothetical protein